MKNTLSIINVTKRQLLFVGLFVVIGLSFMFAHPALAEEVEFYDEH